MQKVPLAKIIAGTVILDILTLAGAWVFGGFAMMSEHGVAALIIGVTLSYALGVGLMVAVFYSSRAMDDTAHNATKDQFKENRDDSES
ncbi:MAG: hypothetical protein AB7F76_12250 [Parvibaculaceae bacterium]